MGTSRTCNRYFCYMQICNAITHTFIILYSEQMLAKCCVFGMVAARADRLVYCVGIPPGLTLRLKLHASEPLLTLCYVALQMQIVPLLPKQEPSAPCPVL